MIFSGRPSSACHVCRVKRLKCDRARPGCSQCSRKRMLCLGYRDVSELRLRDETDRVIRKAREQCPPHDSAVVSTTMNTVADHDIDYLPTLYPAYRRSEDNALSSAVVAASFATFARRSGRQAYMDRASRSYSIALTYINAALEDPAIAVLDQTLAAILLTTVFEGTIFPGAKSPKEWTAHLFGGTRLLHLRGDTQFQCETGRHLYNHITSNMCASCMQRMVDLPFGFQAWDATAGSFLGPHDNAWAFNTIIQKAVSFKARLWARLDYDRYVLFDLFYDAVALEQEAAAVMSEANTEPAYATLTTELSPSWAYNGIACHYKTHRAAKHDNIYRMVRLFMFEVMSAAALINISKTSNQPDATKYFENTVETAHRLSAKIPAEILSCVPDFLDPGSTFANPRFSPAARTLIWPLSVVYKNRICPVEAREYAKGMIEKLVKEVNRLQPVDARKFITEPQTIDDWIHLYHLD